MPVKILLILKIELFRTLQRNQLKLELSLIAMSIPPFPALPQVIIGKQKNFKH